MTLTLEHVDSPLGDESRRVRLQRRQRLVVDAAAAIVAAGFGVVLGAAITAESVGALRAPGGLNMAIGRVAGLTGAYAMMVMVLLMARIPVLERAVGQDRLARWHRQIGPWPIVLIAVHGVFITFGYAESAKSGLWHQVRTLIGSYPDVLAAVVAFGLLAMVGVVSLRLARSRFRYETWWAIHLYVYLALALAFAHQIVTGVSFVGQPLARLLWSLAWGATAGTSLVYRFALPLWRSAYYGLRVASVREEAPGVISVICSGRHLERLEVAGGQFFQWRFLARGLWWQAHPYSLSALPVPPFIRVTVRAVGDHSRSLASLPLGTRVAIEGPYGAFTADRRATDKVLLVGAGVGVTPLRSILEHLPSHVDVTLLVRASTTEDLVLADELETLAARRGGRVLNLVGPRAKVRLDAASLRRLVPDAKDRDVYICGPEGFTSLISSSVRHLGVPQERIHHESFAF